MHFGDFPVIANQEVFAFRHHQNLRRSPKHISAFPFVFHFDADGSVAVRLEQARAIDMDSALDDLDPFSRQTDDSLYDENIASHKLGSDDITTLRLGLAIRK